LDLLDKGYIELVNHMGDDNTVVSAARVSYLGKTKGQDKDDGLIKYLLQNRHTSPFEQVEFQFMVKCPIFVARQWMRHRTWSYNEISRRYTAEDIDFYLPKEFRNQANDNKQMSDGIHPDSEQLSKMVYEFTLMAEQTYDFLVSSDVAREMARMVLPQNMYTSFYAKTDLHNLFHFISLRNHAHAQYEIKVYAEAIEELIKPIVPVSYKYWKELQETK